MKPPFSAHDDSYFYDEVVRVGWCDPIAASAADRGRSPVPPGSTTPHVLRAEQPGTWTHLFKFPPTQIFIFYLL